MTPAESPTALSLLRTLFERVREAGIPLVQLRYKPLDESLAYRGDYDLFTPFERVRDILAIVFELCYDSQNNFTVFRTKLGKTQVVLYDRNEKRAITLELWNYLEVKDPFSKTLRYIFWEDMAPHIKAGSPTLPLQIEALYYLSHLFTKNKMLHTDEIRSRIAHYAQSVEDAQLRTHFEGIGEARSLDKATAHAANMALCELDILRRSGDGEGSVRAVKLRLRIAFNRLYAKLLKRIRITPVVGPDGVGKTTLIEALRAAATSKIKYYRFKRLFRRSLLYALVYRVLHKKLRRETGEKVAKNQVDDRFGLFIFVVAWLRSPLLILQALFSRRFILTDRFFHDFMFEDSRFEFKAMRLRSNWRTMLRLTPKVYWFVQLDAPTDVILARKQEMSREDIRRYRRDMFMLYLEIPSFVYSYVNTAGDVERCVSDLLHSGRYIGLK